MAHNMAIETNVLAQSIMYELSTIRTLLSGLYLLLKSLSLSYNETMNAAGLFHIFRFIVTYFCFFSLFIH